uniref:Ovule protein n=1 Tax=Caenorhabditis tropicalis TaxID=1561998 RepID=A0A1I7UME7_9PELO
MPINYFRVYMSATVSARQISSIPSNLTPITLLPPFSSSFQSSSYFIRKQNFYFLPIHVADCLLQWGYPRGLLRNLHRVMQSDLCLSFIRSPPLPFFFRFSFALEFYS